LTWSRAILSALVAIAIAVAPIGAAWAGLAVHRSAEITGAQHHADAASQPVAEAMHDCASKMNRVTKPHPPCCAKDLACSPEFCIAKCFQLMTALVSSNAALLLKTIRLSALDQPPPPDWSSRPQPPPPRT